MGAKKTSPECLILVGAPGSGKSTLGDSLSDHGFHFYNADLIAKSKGVTAIALRQAKRFVRENIVDPNNEKVVFGNFLMMEAMDRIVTSMVRNLRRKISTVFEGSNTGSVEERRNFLLALAQNIPNLSPSAVFMETPSEICMQRAQNRRFPSLEVVRGILENLEPPELNEGFGKVYRVIHGRSSLEQLRGQGLEL